MQTVLEELQSRLESAQKTPWGWHRAAYQKAQVDLQSATNELNIWNAAVGIEMRETETARCRGPR